MSKRRRDGVVNTSSLIDFPASVRTAGDWYSLFVILSSASTAPRDHGFRDRVCGDNSGYNFICGTVETRSEAKMTLQEWGETNWASDVARSWGAGIQKFATDYCSVKLSIEHQCYIANAETDVQCSMFSVHWSWRFYKTLLLWRKLSFRPMFIWTKIVIALFDKQAVA
jgi:hypothetical protein